MPEGPEIRLSSLYINHVCSNRRFTGKVTKSAVTKNPDVPFTSPSYTITAEARGKELALVLSCQETNARLRLLFRFGMSGRFRLTLASDLPKHSHLQFYSLEEPQYVLSFVDTRRFGSWHVNEGWGKERGPDPMTEHDEFKENILSNLEQPVFRRPICEVLLNQQYFNGIGNYLRAEVLYRAGIPPFICAHDALVTRTEQSVASKDSGESIKTSGLLQLLHDVPLEVVNLKVGLGKVMDSVVQEEDYRAFMDWLQCYEQPTMSNLVDHNGRTIWFKGQAGPLAPKNKKSRRQPNTSSSQLSTKQALDDGTNTKALSKPSAEEHQVDSVQKGKKRKRAQQRSPSTKKATTDAAIGGELEIPLRRSLRLIARAQNS